MTAINIVTLPEYYPLYALYADYPVNNERHATLEDLERVRESLRVLAPLLGQTQPYRKSWALRLFTERQALASFAPELVDEAWRQLRDAVDRLGPPPGWRGRGRSPRQMLGEREPRRTIAAEGPAALPARAGFPKSPVDYRMAV